MRTFILLALMSVVSISAQAQTSTTTLSPRNWNAWLSSQVDTSDKAFRDSSQATYSTTNYVGASYNLSAVDKVYAKHYFSYVAAPEKTGKTEVMDAVLQYSTKTGGLLGSEAISPWLWYYAPTSELSREIHSNGKVRLNAEPMWGLTPRWKVSYYFSPRQTFIPESTTQVTGSSKAEDYFSKTSLTHQANLYYFFNDKIQAYVYGGLAHGWNTTKGTYVDEDVISAVGSYMQFGDLLLNPEVSNSVHIREKAEATNNSRFWQAEDLTYTFVMTLSI